MKVLVRWFKLVFIFIYTLVFLCLIVIEVWLRSIGDEFFTSSVFYWMVLIGWLFLTWNLKWKAPISMISALIFYVIAALFISVGLGFGEILMRLSFIAWMVGITQALIEYRMQNEKK